MNTISATSTEHERSLRGFALACVISALMLTTLLEALDQAIVGTAMPRIIAELHGLDRYTWVVTVYVLASMTMIPVVGKLSDQFGRKWFLLFGTVLFLLGSFLAGASMSMDQLIIFRALQGMGAGIGIALVATAFADIFPPVERARWSGLFALVYGFATLFGPTLGGWLAEHGPLLGNLVTEASRWRWVFYINLPIGLLAVAALVIFMPASISNHNSSVSGWAAMRNIDILGAVLSAVATICLLLGLTWGSSQTYAWSSLPVVGGLICGVVLFVLFLVVELKAADPLLPLDLFRNQVFSVAALLSLIQMMALLGLSLYLPLYLQWVLGISPTSAGLVMTPLSLSMVAGAGLAGVVAGAIKRYQIIAIIGALFMAGGTFLITLMTSTTSLLQAILFMILTGIGAGVFFSLPQLAAQNALPASRLGVGTAATRYLGQLGATLGIAIVGTVVNSSVTGDLMQRLPRNEAERLLLLSALQHGFVAVMIFAVIALLATFFLKDLP
ncbi:MAG TPA: DHA2 family efflux MFS transporter permease subunit, partial [Ktedonobacteraceae bacterium]